MWLPSFIFRFGYCCMKGSYCFGQGELKGTALSQFGFEVQINDNDSAGGRQTLMRWHSDDNDSWQNPSLFGQARLVSSTVGN
jgi:hypothetical protein